MVCFIFLSNEQTQEAFKEDVKNCNQDFLLHAYFLLQEDNDHWNLYLKQSSTDN